MNSSTPLGWLALSLLGIHSPGHRFNLYQDENGGVAHIQQTEKEGKTSSNPLKESFRNKANFKMVLLALFGAVMGQGVVWYTGQFYAQSFLKPNAALSLNKAVPSCCGPLLLPHLSSCSLAG
ncbi:hypothetical protein [Paraflavitalea speifideaquila]|uniref:hypothetical protein n=1 Tax=Paraflavitalea speifideaquila TaxID=3076558 RepID=UPI0028E5D476|nr:hypothetical protein [Paraflavitalea speifideiaquila]